MYRYHRGLEQWSARHFDLVEVGGSNPSPATNFKLYTIMEILTLIIKQKFFDEILSGKKKQEFREIRPNTQEKYCQLDADGYCVEKDGELQPKHYDAIRFFVGYNKDRASALVEVKGAKIELFEDENHNLIEYRYQGETYLAAQVVYGLGRVIETNV